MKPGRVNFILWGILAAIIAGAFVGVYFPDIAEKFKFLGSLFFNALFLIIVPLIVASMIVGITSLGDIRKLGRTARHTITYFMVTSAVAVILGMILGVTFTPGEVGESLSASADKKTAGEIEELKFADISSQSVMVDSSLRFVLRAENGESVLQLGAIGLPAGATFVDKGFGVGQFSWTPGESQAGQYSVSFFVNDRYSGVSTRTMRVSVTDPSDLGVYGMLARIGEAMIQTLNEMIPRNIVAAAADTKVLALIVFSLFFGGVLSSLGAKAKPLITLFEVINDAVMKLVHLVMYLAPFGVFGIVASKVGEKSGDLANAAVGIGMFSAVVILGQVIHGGLLMGVLKYLGDRNPIAYLSNMGPALATALGVSSSSATLPVTMECVVENNKVDQRAASFVLPLGTTINMDGTAMYQALSAIFVCQ
ncbi:MAG: cation:dicarboxylase symporter family transporter, partial [candidate division Zixibacteria bacterium]|nr:cation:dicarboxylase symporter family transporter [candidate division Zixibacteria bacterium]